MLRALAHVRVAGAALEADAAGDVALGRDVVAGGDVVDVRARLDDRARELVAERERRDDPPLRPLVPAEDVQVGAADARRLDLDEHLVRRRFRNRHLVEARGPARPRPSSGPASSRPRRNHDRRRSPRDRCRPASRLRLLTDAAAHAPDQRCQSWQSSSRACDSAVNVKAHAPCPMCGHDGWAGGDRLTEIETAGEPDDRGASRSSARTAASSACTRSSRSRRSTTKLIAARTMKRLLQGRQRRLRRRRVSPQSASPSALILVSVLGSSSGTKAAPTTGPARPVATTTRQATSSTPTTTEQPRPCPARPPRPRCFKGSRRR